MTLYDIAVIGGGPAGYVAAIKAAQLGAKVILIEEDQLGGTCLNHGCIPTKTLLHNAEIVHHVSQAKKRGIGIADPTLTIDMTKMMRQKASVVKKLKLGVGSLLKNYGIEVIAGHALVTPDRIVAIEGTEHRLTAKSLILAMGSEAIRPPIPGADSRMVLTSRELLEVSDLPKSLAIVGGGVIGVEMARIFRAFGVQIHMIELCERLCPFLDREVSEELTKNLIREGIAIHTGCRVEAFNEVGESLEIVANDSIFQAEKVLISVGRKANLSAVESLDLRRNKSAIWVDDRMQTSIPGIYATGDVNGLCMLAHAAFKMSEIAVENALGGNKTFLSERIPGIIYGQPEIAYVGLTEEDALKTCNELMIGRFPFMANGRALTADLGTGFVKIIADKQYGKILGAHIIGPNASELINEIAAMISAEGTVDELVETVHGHPTCAEAIMEAAADALGICVHLPPR